MTNDNSIERQIEIKAPVAKVWKALTDSQQFGQWFKAKCESEFVAGKTTKAKNTSKGFEMDMQFHIKEIKPQTYFSYAWTPFPMDRTFDYSKEEPTLVEFFLEPSGAGTLVKVKESGFNKITASRRAEAFKMHSGGWEAQLQNIEKFLVEK
ncbi:MAG: SRPBCC family protein [Bdellovibrionota bacterium]